jgi:CDP-diacylglycerol--serine O-phosphatidyltransferase
MNFETIVPVFFIVISFLLISRVPTYSLKKIIVPRSMTIFLLFSIVLYFGLLLIYNFKVMIISGMLYLCFIPISLVHFLKLDKKNKTENTFQDNHEDIL